MSSLPTGTVTFLFTDVEGSTTLLQQLTDANADILMECRRLVRAAVQERGGQEVGTQGDAVFAAFPSAREAVLAAVAAQKAILRHAWPRGVDVKVRMGLHTGEAHVAEDDYIGLDVHRAARICAAGHGGQILLSDTVSALVVKDLPDGVSLRDLGEHRLKDLAHPHRLFQVEAPELSVDFPPLKSLEARPNNLPIELTSFIGRERQVAEVRKLLSTHRFVTLTGSGGAGKTRLALHVAAEALEEFPEGVWLVELAALSDASLVPKSVASALGVVEQPGRMLTETLADALRGRSTLVILDNCEHLVAACAHLTTALIRVCPNVRILATSREALGVTGETTWRIPSLSVPDPERLPPLDRFTEYEAVRLFIDRAVANTPLFALTNTNDLAVAQISHRLDGIPLAIELAAARVKVLAVEQIAARLDDRFRLLTGGSRTAVPRQQTLRAAMDWSHDLLSPRERAVLRRLSVFAGGWTLEAAEAVCVGKRINSHEILDLLMQLVDKSLVNTETMGGEVRYRLPETIRQYAQDRLVASKEAAEVRTRHRAWYLSLAERAEAQMYGPEQTLWLNRLEVEHDNLRTAMRWSGAGADEVDETRLRLAAALFRFWYYHTHWAEGRKSLETALAGSRHIRSTARVKALWGAAQLEWRQGDSGSALALFDESLALAQELGDQMGIAQAIEGRGFVAMLQGDLVAATALYEESQQLFRKLGDKWLTAMSIIIMATVVRQKGDYDTSVALCEESLATFRTLGGRRSIAFALGRLGTAIRLQGDLERAAKTYKESLSLFGESGDKRVAIECIAGLAIIASAQGKYGQAARLFGVAEAARETFGITMLPQERGDLDRFGAVTREGLGDEPFALTWAEGRAMTLEQAIEYALAGQTE